MKSRNGILTKVILFVSAFVFSALAAAAQTSPIPPRITQPIQESKLVTLIGNTRPEAKPANDRGALPSETPMEHMLLQLRRSPEQEQALEQYLGGVQKPGSSVFHRWLAAQEFGERYGLAQSDIDAISGWLTRHGFTVNVVYANRMVIDFSGTAGQVREAFHTEIHSLDVNGEKHYANMSDPRIPAALAPAVTGIVSLHDFVPRPAHKLKPAYTFTADGETFLVVAPADLATIYDFNPLFTGGTSGQGQTVVVLEDSDVFSTTDISTFRSTFGLSSYSGTFTQVHPAPVSGTNNCTDPGANSDDSEAELDAEWAGAAAPGATIELASCSDTTTSGVFIALQNLLNESSTPPAVMSISYGSCEAENGAAANAEISSTYQQAVSEGVSVFVVTGDEGAASCDADAEKATHGIGVNGLGSTVYNVAVGGTDFGDTYAGTNATYWSSTNTSTYGSALSYVPEIAWNDSCASVLIATFVTGSGTTYGTSGFCNSTTATSDELIDTSAGSGGPSGCATGSPSSSGVVGGSCVGYPKPSWQSVAGNPGDGVRDLPDVSLFAGNGVWGHSYVFCFSDTANGGAACSGAPSGWTLAGGTSFASPIWAGIQALVNQKAGGSQGLPNPTLYKLAANEFGSGGSSSCNSTSGNAVGSSCIFYDVTQGDMDVVCTGTHNCYLPSGTNGVLSTSDSADDIAYGAGTGWDFATGIGSVNVTNLVNNWTSTSTTSGFSVSASAASPSTVSPGGSATSTITVTASNGFSGTVSLSCSVSPSKAGDVGIPTCSLNPTSVTLSSSATSGTSTVTVNTIASSALMRFPAHRPFTGAFLAIAATITLAWLLFFGAPFGNPATQRRWAALVIAVVLVTIAGLSGCSSSSSGSSSSGGTTADTYTVTVTATSGTTSETGTFTVVVN
jgi:subtilase family serine protease